MTCRSVTIRDWEFRGSGRRSVPAGSDRGNAHEIGLSIYPRENPEQNAHESSRDEVHFTSSVYFRSPPITASIPVIPPSIIESNIHLRSLHLFRSFPLTLSILVIASQEWRRMNGNEPRHAIKLDE
jgi:hypothetical protein